MGRGITEPNAGSDNRFPPEDAPKAGFRLKAERDGEEWILNGEKCFIANGSVGSLFFVDARTNPEVNVKQGGTLFMVPKGHAGIPSRQVFNKRTAGAFNTRHADAAP
jgi:alkylation response protein AidB-like acyl-CoA dehydrogenase